MILKNNKVFINNTHRFLFPILRMYGEEFASKIARLYKLGTFIDDIENPRDDNDDYLHIVVDVKITRKNYGDFLDECVAWMKAKGYLEKCYVLSYDSNKIVLMIRIPEKYQGCIGQFVQGDVDLFSEQDVNKCFQARNKVNEDFFRYCRNVIRTKKRVKIDLDQEILNF